MKSCLLALLLLYGMASVNLSVLGKGHVFRLRQKVSYQMKCCGHKCLQFNAREQGKQTLLTFLSSSVKSVAGHRGSGLNGLVKKVYNMQL